MFLSKSRARVLVFGVFGSVILAGRCLAQEQAQPPKHTIVVKFDYDFTAVPACSQKVSKKCIAKFFVYDISGDKPYKLFTIPVPADASGSVKGISGESQPLLFESGKHLLAVTAQKGTGEESNPHACSVWVTIP
ncbi:MAG: hypothetical protein WBQ04_02045 [Candidatus Acidiferrales bacterium]